MSARTTLESGRGKLAVWTAVAVLGLAVISGCGDDDPSPSGDTSGGSSSDYLAEVQDRVDTYLSDTGTFHEPSASGPAAEPGKKVALISCGQAFPTCEAEMTAASEAADAAGWTSKVYDSKGDPAVASSSIRNAIASDYDGIFVYYIDCENIKAALQDANDAGIPVVGSEALDCEPSLYANGGSVIYAGGNDYGEQASEWGESMGLYAISDLDGEADAVLFEENSGFGSRTTADGFRKAFEGCEGCSVETVEFPFTDIGTKLQGKAEQAFLQNPDANAALVTYVDLMLGGVEAAIQSSGRDLLASANEGTAPAMELIDSGVAKYGSGWTYGWEGYAAIDDLVRILAGEKPVDSGIGVQLFDEEHNMPPSTGYEPPFDYVAAYEKVWSGS